MSHARTFAARHLVFAALVFSIPIGLSHASSSAEASYAYWNSLRSAIQFARMAPASGKDDALQSTSRDSAEFLETLSTEGVDPDLKHLGMRLATTFKTMAVAADASFDEIGTEEFDIAKIMARAQSFQKEAARFHEIQRELPATARQMTEKYGKRFPYRYWF
jgi:hypothetical protein